MKPFLIFLAYISISIASAKDIPWELATSRTTPGRNQPNKCNEFANALFRQMKSNGVKAHVLVYAALPSVAQPIAEGYNMVYKGYEGHAVCIYWEGSEVWAMDNQMMRPRRLLNVEKSDSMARQIAGPDRSISFAYFADVSEPPVPGWEPGPNYRRVTAKP